HSARNLPFRLSMKALSVGLPGREKSSVIAGRPRGRGRARRTRFPGLVQAELGDELLQLPVLLLRLAQPAHLGGHHAAVALPPVAERRLADPGFPAHLADCRSLFGLPQHERDLRLAEPRSLHRLPPSPGPIPNWKTPPRRGPENGQQVK